MSDIQKPFHLATGKTINLKGRAVDLLKTVVVPVRHGGQRHRILRIEGQTGPDQTVTLLHRIAGQVELRRNRLIRAGGDAVAAAILAKTQPVIRADNPFVIVKSKGQRYAAMRTDIAGDHDLIFYPVDHQLFVQQRSLHRCRADIAGAGHRMPAFCQAQPVFRLEGAMGGRRGMLCFHGCPSCSRKSICLIVVTLLLPY